MGPRTTAGDDLQPGDLFVVARGTTETSWDHTVMRNSGSAFTPGP